MSLENVLKMAKVHAIIGLLEQHWSYRRISRELGVDRETVSRYARLRRERKSKPAIPTPWFRGSSLPELLFPVPGLSPGRASQCETLREVINAKLELGLSAQRIFQDIVIEYGFSGSYSSVKRFVRRLGSAIPLPFRRMEMAPGIEAQVDFGTGAWVIADGRKRRPHVLRVTLYYSRKSFSEPVFRQTTENFIRVSLFPEGD